MESNFRLPPTQRFPARDLPPYAEPVSPADLTEGSVYFAVTFADEELTIPIVKTLVFIGRNLEPDDSDRLYIFQDIYSYRRGVRYSGLKNRAAEGFEVCRDVNHIFQYERALNQLMLCSLRRKQASMNE